MPRFDGTGPKGRGPMTGRGTGKCGSSSQGRSSKKRCGGYFRFSRGGQGKVGKSIGFGNFKNVGL